VFRDQIHFGRRLTRRLHRSAGSEVIHVELRKETNSTALISNCLEAQARHFCEHGWAYLEDFFSSKVYEDILQGWRSRRYFSMKADLAKSYDRGPRWTPKNPRVERGIDQRFYSGFVALAQPEFATRVEAFVGDNQPRHCSSTGSAWARSGHHLLPHVDNASRHGALAVINFVIFVDGRRPSIKSGGTSTFQDNTFDRPVCVPTTLQNSAIVYGTGISVFHGFPKVGFRKFSKRIVCQFSPTQLVEST
jgi:hypothetical protein